MGEPATTIDSVLRGVIARAQDLASDEEVARWEAQRATELRGELLESSGIGEVLSAAGMGAIVADRAKSTRALELTRGWLASQRPVFGLFGGVGVGKTVAAAWALARVPGRYVELGALVDLRRDPTQRERYRATLSCELLVVDELGSEERSDRGLAALHEVINRRQRLPRRTMLLGNLNRADLEARYDKRSLDRLAEVGVLRSVDGPSLRGAR